MKYNWVPVFVWFYLRAVHSQRLLEDDCPEAEDIEPCECGVEYTLRKLTCRNVNNFDTLRRVFQNMEGYYYHEILIDNSTLKYIPHEILEKTSAKYLYLIDMTLSNIFDAPPHGVNSITKLALNNVRVLRDISWSFFQGFTNLKVLYMVNTPISILGPSFSEYMSKTLESVWFVNAEIKEIKQGALSQFSNLSRIHFDDCDLTSFTRDILPRPWIKGTSLSFKFNKISSISDDLFTDMPNLRYLNLGHNFISELPESAFQGTSVRTLYLTDNPLKCDCQMQWLLKKELVKSYYGKCASPKRLEGKYLQNLTTSDFQCIGSTLTNLN